MVNKCELSEQNVVISDKPKMLTGFNQKVSDGDIEMFDVCYYGPNVTGVKREPNPFSSCSTKHGNPVRLLKKNQDGKLRNLLMAVREKDAGKSESCIVTMQILIETMIRHESEPTSGRSLIAREFGEPIL